MTHHHRHRHNWPRGLRLLPTRLHFDAGARRLVCDELGDYLHCWREIAEHLIDLHANDLVCDIGWTKAVRYIESGIACSLDAIARRRGGITP